MRQYSSSRQGRGTLPETSTRRIVDFPAIRYMARPVPLAGSATPPPPLSFLSDEQLTDKWAQLSLASPAQNDCHKVDK